MSGVQFLNESIELLSTCEEFRTLKRNQKTTQEAKKGPAVQR